jgi:hypothetical protein
MQIEPQNTLENFGKREIDLAIKLLEQYKKEIPDNWNDKDVYLDLNLNSGKVFLANSDCQTMLLRDDGKLGLWLTTPYDGKEGFIDDLVYEFFQDEIENYGFTDFNIEKLKKWNEEDVNFIFENYDNVYKTSAYKDNVEFKQIVDRIQKTIIDNE